MGDVPVGRADTEDLEGPIQRPTGSPRRPIRTRRGDPLLDGHEQFVLCGELCGQADVDRLAKRASATVTESPCSARMSAASTPSRRRAVAEQRDALALAQDLAVPISSPPATPGQRDPDALARGYLKAVGPSSYSSAVRSTCQQASPRRAEPRHEVPAGSEVRDVEHAVWVGPSSPTSPARSMTKRTFSFCRQTSWTIWSIRAWRTSSRSRRPAASLQRHPGREQHRLLLGDSDVEIVIREAPARMSRPCPSSSRP